MRFLGLRGAAGRGLSTHRPRGGVLVAPAPFIAPPRSVELPSQVSAGAVIFTVLIIKQRQPQVTLVTPTHAFGPYHLEFTPTSGKAPSWGLEHGRSLPCLWGLVLMILLFLTLASCHLHCPESLQAELASVSCCVICISQPHSWVYF